MYSYVFCVCVCEWVSVCALQPVGRKLKERKSVTAASSREKNWTTCTLYTYTYVYVGKYICLCENEYADWALERDASLNHKEVVSACLRLRLGLSLLLCQ